MTACRAGDPHLCGIGVGHHRFEIQYKKEGTWALYGYTEFDPEEDERGRILIEELIDKGYLEEDIRVEDTEKAKT